MDATEDENAISAITFNNTRQPDNITVNKAWAYTTENSAIATESRITLANGTQWPTGTTVTIQLQKQVGEGEIVDVEGKSAILSADQPSYTFTGLVQYEGDDEITYSVKETKIEGTYAEHFELEKTEQKNDGSFLITNKEKTAELTLTKSVTVNNGTLADMDIQFVVKDEDGETVTTVTMKYPSEFTDGSKSVRLTQADGILPGETYTVIETATSAQQAGYTRTTTVTVGETATPFTGIDNPSGTVVINEDTNLGSIEFGNAYILETVDIEVDKAWLNADGSKTWPNGVTVGIQLTADGSDVTGKTATLSADQTSYKFTSLPKYKADGTTAIAYSVKEAEVPGYDSDVGTLTNGKITVTNTQETVEVEVDKAWLNADGSKTWPNGVTVGIQLTADGSDVTGKTATLSADQTSYKFTSLPKYKADGTTEIAYSVKEAEVPGYDSDVGTLTNGKITVTNTQETVEVEVDKAWLNADGSKTWPNGVTVGIQLTADGSDVTGKTATLSADQTSYKFTSLPKYKADGTTAIAYSVKEAEVPGYDSDVGTLTNGKITVTNTQETVEVEVDKAWLNADGSKTWPNGVTVGIQLTADGSDVTGKTATLSADQTSYKFTSLPKYKADGTTEIAYSVKEAEVPGYDSDVGTLTNGKITVTNTQETVEVEVDKAWLNADGSKTWPNGVTVGIQLTADGSDVTGKTATLSADQTSYKFTSLPKYKADGTTAIAYSVKEAEVPGYDSDVGTLTNGKITVTNTQETVEVEVDKAWLNADGSKTWPNGVTVGIQLTADGSDVTGKTATLSADQTSYKFTSLPKYKADGTTAIAYSVKEAEVPGYDSDVGTLTNGKITVTNTQETVEVEVDKAWLNADGSKTWPNGVTVGIQLTADGSDVTGKTATLSADQTSYKFTSLPKYKADGTTAIAYSVKEAEVPGYGSEVSDLTNGKITITNKQGTVDISVDKAWLNADGSKTWPNGVTVGIQLTADGSDVTDKTATLSADQTSYKFTSLPKYKADGTTEIAYSVKEAEVPGYDSDVGTLTNGKITVTNTQETVEVEVDKAWLNADGSKTWPNGVTVGIQLTADGSDVTGKTATLSADQTSYKFTSLPKYKADGTTAIAYSVKEAEVPGYDSDVGTLTNGKITVTNTQETVEVEVDKAWLNADGSKTWPNGVTVGIQLTADGSDVTGKTATLSADQTSYKFTSLPKYKADGTTAIAYSVKEAEVPGYDSDVGTLTNGKITVTNTQETVEVEVDKAWLNADGSKTWPNGVTVGIQLTADGSDVTGKTATLSADQTSYKFTSLPKYKADGTTAIAYSVKEAEVPGYGSEVSDLTNGKITITNKQGTVDISVDKAWLNADGSKTWPNGVTVGIQLTADGSDVTGKTATLSADQTSYKFTSLPKYKADGTTAIAYSVKEAEVPGYDSDVGTLTNGKITVTNTQETVEVEVDKAWLNADGSKTWPNGVTVGIQLTADGSDVTGKTATLSADQTSYKFTSLPKYKADGTTAIAYSVKEAEVPGYDSDVGTLTNGKITVTNTQETVEVEVDKAWLNADGSKTWPNGVTVGIQLTADGSDVTGKTATLSADQTSYKFTSLPKYKADGTTEIAYSVKEAEVPGYDSDVGTLTNGKITVTNTQETLEVEVDKAWLNADGSKTWPNGVTVGIQLTADGSDVTGKTATLSADQTSYKFTSLPKYKADGTTEIAYSVKEAEVPGYDSDVGTLTNGKITVTNTQETVEVEVDKAWLNADGSKTWPNGVTVGIQLTADGSDVTGKTATLSADQTSYKFTSLPKYKADGTTAIAYSVKEAEVPGYDSDVGTLTNGKITVTNTQETVEVEVDKAWLNADGSKTWPNGVTVGIQLTADGSDVTDKTATLSADQTSYKFTSLPKYKADGTTAIAYSVKEAEVPGYDSDVGTLANGKITVTNTQETVEVEVDKAWLNADGSKTWPNGVTVGIQLTADGSDVTGKTATLSADQTSYKFTSLPKYKADGTTAIAYSVKEAEVPGYDSDVGTLTNGKITVTNTQETVEVEVDKAWLNADGSKTWPNGVTVGIQLTADGSDVTGKTATLSADQTSYKFTSLPKYKADGTTAIAYSVKEAEVPGYGSEVSDLTNGKITITNKQGTVDISVDKAWLNADGSKTWPNGVTVGIQLMADGSDVTDKTATLSADQTSYKFTSLPKYKADGTTEIAYSVKEAEVPGYDSDVGTLTNGKITVTNTQETVEVEVDKAWLNADGSKTWPNGVTVGIQLTADGSDVTDKTATLSADQTSYKFTSLPKYKADGTTAIAYSVKEAEVPGYDSDVGTLTNGKITVTNTQETVEVEVDKAWLNADGSKTWPNGVTVGIQLTADGSDVTGKTATLSADQTSYKFTSLPKYKADGTTAIAYSVKEAEVPGYDSDVGTLTNGKITVTNTQETVEVEVDKAWLNADGSKTWPNGVTVGIQLTADGSDVTGKTATLSADQTSYKFTSLPKYKADGTTEIAYSVKEAEVPGYDSDVGTLTNGKITVTNTQETVEVEVDKAWLNADGSKTWPNGVTVGIQLTADGSDVTGKTATLSADQTSYKFTSLPKYKADGTTEIAYSVKEAEVPGYDSDVGTLTNGKITVTNTQETVEVEVDKAWLNADGSKTWPNGVTVGIQLTADGSDVTGKTATLSADQTSYKFTSLPKYKADGTTEIAYSVKEAEVPGYDSDVGTLTNGKITVTNTQETVEVEVDKAWLNADGSKTWPNGVTVGIQLTADGSDVTGKTATLSADQTSYKFTSLPKYKADGTTAIAYSVKEAEVPGYDSDVAL
ncbi:Cna B-type domain-containing protein [Clostridiales bacterium FE2010]|nr:Cna B-type domain-containing protein [Clostridiales bacterium FE2010]